MGNFEQELIKMTTLITTDEWIGSGFFYDILSPKGQGVVSTNGKGEWRRFEKFFLITNRHMVLGSDRTHEHFPDGFKYRLRKSVNDQIDWHEIEISKEKLKSKTLFHSDSDVDIAVIDITEDINNLLKLKIDNIVVPTAITDDNLPTNQPIPIEVTDDIIVASYPRAFYDDFNKFPIIKSGIIASGWGLQFKGQQLFEIDAQLFPGSSGGLVISKPKDIAIIQGELSISPSAKQFVLLGVYSGEYSWYDNRLCDKNGKAIERSYGLGNVWYSYLIPDIINTGINLDL